MVINKTNKSSSKKLSSSEVRSSSTTQSGGSSGGNVQTIETVTTVTQQLPIMQERLVQKSGSSSHVTKSSSSSSKMSSQEQKFYSTSSSSKSSSKTQQLQSQSDDFLRGERMIADIDAKRSNNGTIIIESVDLQNSSSSAVADSSLKNLVSVEIESKDSYAHKSSNKNEFSTTTHSTFSSSGDQNRNDVIVAVESGKSSNVEKNSTVAATSGDVKNIQGSNVTSSSSTYEEFSSSSMASSSVNNNNNVETRAASSKNVASSKTIKSADGKNVADTTTTFTSKVYDDKTKTWVVVEQSSVNETDIILPGSTSHITSSSTTTQAIDNNNKNNSSTMMTMNDNKKSTEIDSKNVTSVIDSSSSSNKMMQSSSDVKMSTKSTKEVLEKSMSNKKESSRNEKSMTTKTNETIQVFDNKTKTWINIDENSLDRQKRPSYVRYRSQDSEGKWHTIYKRKMFDEFSKQWRIVDEKVVTSGDTTKLVDIPEMIENSTNITTTTYTTKIYDTKTGKWSIVEEKSYVDTEPVNITQDIKQEIERDQPDLANIITTTETTKVSEDGVE